MTVVALLLASALLAPSKPAAEGPCPQALTTREMEECLGAELTAAQGVLEVYLRESARHTEGQARTSLEVAQQAWSAYRTAHCEAVHKLYADASIRGVEFLSCGLTLTRARTRELWGTYLARTAEAPAEPGS